MAEFPAISEVIRWNITILPHRMTKHCQLSSDTSSTGIWNPMLEIFNNGKISS